MQKSKKGFTLIELLVVISIIGLLASVVLASLNTARSKARDAQRLGDLHQLQNALLLYYDKNGQYPDTAAACNGGGECSSAQASWNTAVNPLYVLVTQGFISKLPVDPKNTPANNALQSASSDYSYYYSDTSVGGNPNYRQTYDLLTRLENAGNQSSCQIKGQTYCQSIVWVGWNWKNDVPNGDALVYYHP